MEEKSDSKEVLNIDELTERVGPFGLYQIRIQFLFFLLMLPLTYQVLIMYFVAENPPWHCKHESKVCLYKGLLTSNMGKKFQRRCYLNRSEWEYSTSKDLSIVTEVKNTFKHFKFHLFAYCHWAICCSEIHQPIRVYYLTYLDLDRKHRSN